MDMIVRPAGEPRLDLRGLVGGVVIHDDMDIEPFGDLLAPRAAEFHNGNNPPPQCSPGSDGVP